MLGQMDDREREAFFARPPPPGRSRESSIVLDERGRFWHDGELVRHGPMHDAFSRWVDRHPKDGRFILNNGYDWSYISVAGAPFQVLRVSRETPRGVAWLELSDGTCEPLDAAQCWFGREGVVWTRVKQGRFTARMTPAAQLGLAEWLEEGDEGEIFLRVGQTRHRMTERPPDSEPGP